MFGFFFFADGHRIWTRLMITTIMIAALLFGGGGGAAFLLFVFGD